MRVDILSLFPEYFESPLKVSILKRAIEKGYIDVHLTNVRDFGEGKYRKVDDRPYGGGAGMVLKPGPVTQAIRSIETQAAHVVYLSPQGEPLNTKVCQELATYEHLVFVCGHYEGLDERVIEAEVDRVLSIGDYVLTNGCLAALVTLDALVRWVPGVLGDEESALYESFSEGLLEGPCYTRPEEFEGRHIPEVLKNGNHAEIHQWRWKKALEKTKQVRPDLLRG